MKKKKPKKKIKVDRLSQNLTKVVHQFMMGRSYEPMSESDLFTRLQLPPQHRDIFSAVVEVMVQEKILDRRGGLLSPARGAVDAVQGIIKLHPRGFGFVQPDKSAKLSEDIFIPKHLTLNAVDGDRVEVIINMDSISDKGPEGKVAAILERARTHLAGTVRDITPEGDVIVYAPLLGKTQRILLEKKGDEQLLLGDRLVMEVLDWGRKDRDTICRLSHVIGNIDNVKSDIPAAVEEFSLRDRFPVDVLQEANEFPSRVLAAEMEGRKDLRDVPCFTIDPDTAKDYDDALALTKDKEGRYHLMVHIADVTHYLKKGSPLDVEAAIRCNSVYFPGVCIPMLPEALSNNLCSLKADVNRLAASVIMTFGPDGELLHYEICRTVIRSVKRMTYREAKRILDGEEKSPYKDTLDLMVELCRLFKKQRYNRGSIEFALPELMVLVDKEGEPTGTDYVEYDVTHQLVEEFMLKANEMVAIHLTKIGKHLTYRVHDEPAEENLRDFSELARAFGYDIPEKPTVLELQKFFDEAVDSPYGPYLATSFIRRMRMASYSPENIGHYGLALTHYCHFTSPIRRYADVVVHRVLFGEGEELENIQKISLRCSEAERLAAKAENSVVLLKKLRLLKKMIEKEPYKQFEAVVTRVKQFGFFFEVIDMMVEGFIHVSEMGEDYFEFQEEKMRLRGRKTGKMYTPGLRIIVTLSDIDLIQLETRWYIIPETGEVKTEKRSERRVEKKPAKNSRGAKKDPSNKSPKKRKR